MKIAKQAAVVGIGATPYYRRGESHPQTFNELICKAIINATEDAGLSVKDIDGFSYYSTGTDTGLLMESLGIPEVRYSSMVSGGGGGSVGAVQNAAMAVATGAANVVMVPFCMQQPTVANATARSCSRSTPRQIIPLVWLAASLAPATSLQCWLSAICISTALAVKYFVKWLCRRAKMPSLVLARFKKPLIKEEYFAGSMIAVPLWLLSRK